MIPAVMSKYSGQVESVIRNRTIPSTSLLLNLRVQALAFAASILGGEAPVDAASRGVAPLLPGGYFGVEGGLVREAPVEALAAEDAQFDLGDVEPAAVLGGVVDLQPLRQPLRLGGWEGLVQ